MGAYLRKPLTEKSSTHGERTVGDWRLRYAATAMQGWRISMEVSLSTVWSSGCYAHPVFVTARRRRKR